MNSLLAATIGAALGAIFGILMRRNLATLTYRTSDEQHLPAPGRRYWVLRASSLTLTGLGVAGARSPEPWLWLPLLPIAIIGPWVAAVDLDVKRIPNRSLAPTTAATAAAVAITSTVLNTTRPAVMALIGAVLCGAVLALVHEISRGGLGFGDVKLAALIGLALGPLGIGTVWIALLAGTITALLWVAVRRPAKPFAYGPWLLLGSCAAAAIIPLLAS